ncbi:methyltransferase domain-containing protein [Nesterenkonia sp. K-15-9-6]|uniref:methyltransferase domain-containing protein n=1 Tax=Nesterenkonia sp. K-15-9-6 TaxID=3093918 RepID=UPI0040442BEB
MTCSPQSFDQIDPMREDRWPLRCPLHLSTAPTPLTVLTELREADELHARSRIRGLTCAAGHRFDAARQGYVNLLVGAGSRATPDTAAMIMARERIQDAGVFSALTSALREIADIRMPQSSRPVLLDCGAGTGHHLRSLLEGHPSARGIALDLSPAGLKRAARHPRTLALAWDLWRDLPLQSSSVDLLLDIFAPRNVDEYARVLAPGGAAVVVTPRPGHLAELADGGLLAMRPDKHADLTAHMGRRLGDAVERRRVRAHVPVAESTAVDLVMMGPAGHHREAPDVAAAVAEAGVHEVTVDLDVTVWIA